MTFKEFAKTNNLMWISPKQAAKLMQCSIWHVYDLAKSGQVNTRPFCAAKQDYQ